MAKEELIEMHGKVDEACPICATARHAGKRPPTGGYTNGKMRKHSIRILAGDRVTLEMSPYDLNKGRITFRHIENRTPRWVLRTRTNPSVDARPAVLFLISPARFPFPGALFEERLNHEQQTVRRQSLTRFATTICNNLPPLAACNLQSDDGT